MAQVYLIPSVLHEEGLASVPAYVTDAVKDCAVFFTENERTARRYLKRLWKDIPIDQLEWFAMDKHDDQAQLAGIFKQKLQQGKNIGIISEAGCPGIADPGQLLVAIAQEMDVAIQPLTGPNSILLALMASGMNGQQFSFMGYLPIREPDRAKAIRELEAESKKKKCTQIFIEAPYRNDQLFEALLKHCHSSTRLCVAVDLTAGSQWIKTRNIAQWQKNKPVIGKRPATFLVYAGD